MSRWSLVFPSVAAMVSLALVGTLWVLGQSLSPEVVRPENVAAESPPAFLSSSSGAGQAAARNAIAQLPLRFIERAGSQETSVRFTVQGIGHSIGFGPDAVTLVRSSVSRSQTDDPGLRQIDASISTLRMSFVGANAGTRIDGRERLGGVVNYWLGPAGQWQDNVPTYQSIAYRDLYPGIDLLFRGTDGLLKREFAVAAGANPGLIRLAYEGSERVFVREDGALVVVTRDGELVEDAPILFQEVAGQRLPIAGHYVVDSAGLVGFEVGAYDAALPLIIDPELHYSSFLGGAGNDIANGIAVDSSGAIYLAGATASSAFPLMAPVQGTYGTNTDAFVTKIISANGVYTYAFSSFIGGAGNDQALAIATDAAGTIYVAGQTASTAFPTTTNALQPAKSTGTDAFLAKLVQTSGVYTIEFSSYLGGGGTDNANAVAVDPSGAMYVAGQTGSNNFPMFNPIQGTFGGSGLLGGDVFVTKIISAGGVFTYAYSSYLGGGFDDIGNGLAVDSAGNIYLVGQTTSSGAFATTPFPTTANALQPVYGGGLTGDAFLTILAPSSGSYTYTYSSFLGGGAQDIANAVAVDAAGAVYIAGQAGTGFPVSPNRLQNAFGGGTGLVLLDGFVTKIVSATGTFTYAYSSYLGGSGNDIARAIVVDSNGVIYVAGETPSANFVTTTNAIQPVKAAGTDAFVTSIITANGALTYGMSSFLGAAGTDTARGVAVDTAGRIFLAGQTGSSGFPATPNAIDTSYGGANDAFLAIIAPVTNLSITVSGPATAVPGLPVAITVVVQHVGGDPAMSAPLTTSFGSALTGMSWTCAWTAGSACLPPSGTGDLNALLNVNIGGVITITANGLVDPAATGTVTPTAGVAAAAGLNEANLSNNFAGAPILLTPVASVGISKTDGQTTAVPGTPVTYTLVVTNAGPSYSYGATVSDTLPGIVSGGTWTCASTGGSACDLASGSGNVSLPVTLTVGGPVTLTVSGLIDPAATGYLTNTAAVTNAVGTTDPDSSDNSATDIDMLTPVASVGISKTDGQATAAPGTPVTYTLVVTNAGPSYSYGATVSDVLPGSMFDAAWACVGGAGSSCGQVNGGGNVNVPVTLTVGGRITVTVSATINAAATGALANTAGVANAAGTTDPSAADNAATDVDLLTPVADLAITKTDGVTSTVPGTLVTYTLVVTNAGPSVAAGALVSDHVPSVLTGTIWTCTAGVASSCGQASGSGNVGVPVTVTVGGRITVTVRGLILAGATGVLTNSASVTPPAGTTDPNLANNGAIDVNSQTPKAGLIVTLTSVYSGVFTVQGGPSVGLGPPGGYRITYTLMVTNTGPSLANGTLVTASVGAAVSNVQWTCTGISGGTCGAPAGAGNALSETVNLPAGGVVRYIITGAAPNTAFDPIVAVGAATPPAGVVNPNGSAIATSVIKFADPVRRLFIQLARKDSSAGAGPPAPANLSR